MPMIAFETCKADTFYVNSDRILMLRAHPDDNRRTFLFVGHAEEDKFLLAGGMHELAERINDVLDAAMYGGEFRLGSSGGRETAGSANDNRLLWHPEY
jgi:hypothetical protein